LHGFANTLAIIGFVAQRLEVSLIVYGKKKVCDTKDRFAAANHNSLCISISFAERSQCQKIK
jgi:hypothetical protein